jgi:ribose 5-phosphate isomerase B
MKIYISCDHTGFDLKEKLKIYFTGLDHEIIDNGPLAYDAGDDYPDFIRPMAEAIAQDQDAFGVVIGGSGQGEAMCANRISGVRAAVFYGEAIAQEAIDIKGGISEDPYEIIKLARVHNNANVLSLSKRFLSEDQIKFAIELFITTEFKNEERHLRRIKKLN